MLVVPSKPNSLSLTPASVIKDLGKQDIAKIRITVPSRGSVKGLALYLGDLFRDFLKKQKPLIDFDKVSNEKTGHKLLCIKVNKNKKCPAERIAKAVFSKGCKASFALSFNPKDKTCGIDFAYRRGLPAWTQIGNKKNWISQEKGIPTAKVILSLLIKSLNITPYNIEKISLVSLSAQTTVDVMHSTIIGKQSYANAFASSASAHLASELGDMLNGETALIYVRSSYSRTRYKLSDFFMLDKELQVFEQQQKIKDLYESTGLDLRDKNHRYYPTLFHMGFSFRPRIKLADLLIPPLQFLKKGELGKAKTSLRVVRKLSAETESRVYHHFFEILKRKNLVKQQDPHYGRKVFKGERGFILNSASIASYRIAAIQETMKKVKKATKC